MDERDWATKELPPSFGPFKYELEMCPGWVQEQPAVRDGVRAYAARKDGVLEAYFPGLENTVLEAAEVALQAFNVYEMERMKELKNKAG